MEDMDIIFEKARQERLREVALKDFMCAIIQGSFSNKSQYVLNADEIADRAKQYTNAYLEQLNKPL